VKSTQFSFRNNASSDKRLGAFKSMCAVNSEIDVYHFSSSADQNMCRYLRFL